MKKILLILILCGLSLVGFATTYINVANKPLNVVTSWTTTGLVGGAHPASFNIANTVFNLNNNPGTQTWSGTWALAATKNITLNINYTGAPVVLSGALSIKKNTSVFTIASGATLDLATYTLVNGATTTINGKIRTAATGVTPIPSAKVWNGAAGTLEYYGTSSQTVVAGTYSGTLAISGNRTGKTITLAGAISVGNAFTYSATGSPSFTVTGNTFTYAKLTGGMTIVSAIPYYKLTLSNTSGTNSVNGNLTVNNTLTTTAGGTLDMVTYTLGGTLTVITNNGTIKTQNTSGTPVPTGKTWGGTVNYNLATGGQTVMAGTYGKLTLSNTSGVNTASAAIRVTGTLTTTAGGTFNMAALALTLTGATITNNGTVETIKAAGAFVGAANWGSAGTVIYNDGAAQSVITATYHNLTIGNGAFNYTASGNITVNGALNINAGSTFIMGANILGGTPTTITNNGTITTACVTGTSATPIPAGYSWGGTVNYNSAAATSQTIVTGTYTNLSLSNHTTGPVTLASGTIKVSGNFVVTAGTTGFITTGNTVEYTALTGGQTIPAIPYNNLKLDNTSGVNTAGAAITVGGTLTTTAGGTFNMAALALTLTGATINNNGTIETIKAAGAFVGAANWGSAGTVIYNDGAAQSVITGTYHNLTIGNGVFNYTASGNITVNGALTVNAGSTLIMGANILGGTPTTITNNGTIATACVTGTSATPIPAGYSWGGTVNYNSAAATSQTIVTGTYTNLSLSNHTTGPVTLASGTIRVSGNFVVTAGTTVFTNTGNTFEYTALTGGQTIGGIKYNNLTLDNTSGVNTAGGAITVGGTLTTTAGGTFDMAALALTLTGATINNNGTVQTIKAAGAFVGAANWGSAGTVIYNNGAAQSVIAGTYNNLIIGNGAFIYTLSGAITVHGGLTINASSTFSTGANYQINIEGDWTNNGAAFTAGAGTVVFDGTSAQAIGGSTSTAFHNLTISNTGAAVSVNTNANVSTVLSIGANALLTPAAGVVFNSAAAAGTISGSGTIQVTRTAATADLVNQFKFTTYTLAGMTVNYAGTGAQNINNTAGNYGYLVTSGSGIKTLDGAIIVNKNITIGAGTTLDVSASNYQVTAKGNFTNNGTFTAQNGKVLLNGATNQSIIGSVAFYNLTLNNSTGLTLTNDETVNGTLTLTSGIITLGANNLVLGTAAVAGTLNSSNMIVATGTGQVRRLYSANGSYNFPVGDAANYSPVTLNFTGGTYAAGAYAGVNVTNAKDPHNANTTNYLNRYWTVTTSGITSPVYKVTKASYAAADVTGNEASMVLGAYTGSSPWIIVTGSSVNTGSHFLAATGTITNTNTEISGINSSDATVNITSPDPTTVCNGGSVELDANAVGTPVFTYTWTPSSGLSATTGATVNASPATTTIYTVSITDGIGGTASSTYTVTVTPAVTASASNNGPICYGGTINLNANPGGAASAYAWSGPNLSSSTVAAPSATPTATVTYSVTVSDGTTNPGCVLQQTTSVTVNPQPVAAPVNSGPVCNGNTVTLTATPSGGATTYAWTGPNLSSATAQNPTATPTVTSTYSLTVSSGSGSGCSPVTIYTTSVTVNPLPTISSIGNNGPICTGNTLNITSTETGGTGPGTYSYSWAGPALFTSSTQNSSIGSATIAASGTYTLTVTDANSCIAGGINTTTATVNAYSAPAISAIGNNSPLCLPNTLDITSAASGGTGSLSYSWVGPNSFTSTLQNPTIPGVTTAAAGIYTLTVTDANGCVAFGANITTTTINPTPDAGTISGAFKVCVGSTVILTDGVAGGVWSMNGSAASINSTSGLVTGVAMGCVIVSYTVSTAGCTNYTTHCFNVEGTVGDIYTVAGTGTVGYTGDGGLALSAEIRGISDIATDNSGNVYFCDVTAHVIRKIAANGIITTVVGTGTAGNGGDGGQATAATLNGPLGVYVDNAGNIFISNTQSHTIRKVNGSTGIITTIAGQAGTYGATGDGGPASAARIYMPLGLTGDASGNLYFCDQGNYKVRMINGSTGIITTIAGTGSNYFSGDGGPGTAARMSTPRGLALDNSANLYISDGPNGVVRKLSLTTGIITTVAGIGGSLGYSGDGGPATAATLRTPQRLAFDGGNMLYITDFQNAKVRQLNLSTGIINTVGGSSQGFGGDGGAAVSGQMNAPFGIGCDKFSNVHVADANNHRLRAIPQPVSIGIILAGPTSVPSGTPVTFTAFASMQSNVTYQWQINASDISGATNNTYTDNSPVSGSVYTCKITISPECSSVYTATSNSITVTTFGPPPPSEIKTPAISQGLNVFPNPVHGMLNVTGTDFADGIASITVYDQLTRVVLTKSVEVRNGKLSEQLDMQSMANGIYIISITDNESKVGVIKCIKN